MTAADMPDTAQETASTVEKPRGRPYRTVRDIRSLSMLGVGMIVGAVIGAGVALLLAPGSGYETRRSIKRRVGGIRAGRGAWARLGRELRRAAAAKRKSLEIEARRKEVLLHKAKVGNA